ncbi:putative diphthamide synthesis protein-domain-containing protein [Pavlovales sp. CCMP2436]|nr:putative diphthamide synthesis protein-domain-containing protein [Pavlovales sp. CCMP2436]
MATAPVDDAFEIAETAACVLAGGYARVALQFPDELVSHATAVHAALTAALPAAVTLYVLADCTFDGSQLDFVAAQHVDAQLLVHYGGAQLEVSGPIPARLVFPRRHVNVPQLAAALAAALELQHAAELDGALHLAVLYELGYAHAMSALAAALATLVPGRVSIATVPRYYDAIGANPAAAPAGGGEAAVGGEELLIEGFRLRLPPTVTMRKCALVYVGEEDAPLDAIVLTSCAARTGSATVPELPELPVLLYTPAPPPPAAEPAAAPPALRRLVLQSARRLMRRYYLVQRARDVPTFGLVVATLSAAHFRELLEGLKAALTAAGRRYYVLLMGKLNPAKLANFPDIGMFVILGSARASMVDSRDFLAPVITPHELLLALSTADGEWTGEYVLDFQKLLPKLAAASRDGAGAAGELGAGGGGAADAEEEEEGPRLSLLTGRLHVGDSSSSSAPLPPAVAAASGGAVTIAYERTVATYDPSVGGASYLHARQFQGLDATPGTHAVQAGVAAGRAGIASVFAGEGSATGGPGGGAPVAVPAEQLLLETQLTDANSLNDSAVLGLGVSE